MKQFLPFLTDDQGRSLTVENEVVVTRSLPDPLDNSPEGWETNVIQFTRNNEFRGIIKSYTTSLKFFLQGAKILRDAFYRKGMETVLFFIWLKLDQSFGGGMKYKGWYKGEPDFGTFKDEYDGVQVNITEGGFYKDLQANKTVIQEIPFDKDSVSLYIDGVNLRQKLNYSDLEDLEVSASLIGLQFLGPYALIGQDGASTGFLAVSEELAQVSGTSAEILASDNFIIKNLNAGAVDITITGKMEFVCTAMVSSPAYAVRFSYLTSGMSFINLNTFNIIQTNPMTVGTTYSQDINFTITLNPNETLLRYGTFFNGIGSDAVIKFTANSRTSITFITRQVPSVISTYRVFDLGNKLTAKVSPGASLTSPLLEPDFNLLVTSGDAIRSLPDAVIKTSFSDWHKSIDAVKCVELDVVDNNPVLYDRYSKWNKGSQIAALGECNKWTLEPADEYIYDSVEVGYPAKAVDSNIDVNGKYSFNNTFTWKLNKTRRKVNLYSAKSVYFADPYDIALIRVNLENKTTTTGSTDNSNFFLDAELKTDITFTGLLHFYHTDNKVVFTATSGLIKFLLIGSKFKVTGSANNDNSYRITAVQTDGLDISLTVDQPITTSEDISATLQVINLYQLRRPIFDSITGIPNDGTVFNLLLSPGHILKNHLRWLRSSFDHLDGNKLIFQTTEKNKDLVTVMNGVRLEEKADIPVSTMGEKVYLPYYTSFEIKSPDNLLGLMTANNSGKFDYTMGGVAMDGFPIDIKTEDTHLETQTYKLLQTANCNNLLLINNR